MTDSEKIAKKIVDDVLAEAMRQDERWGPENNRTLPFIHRETFHGVTNTIPGFSVPSGFYVSKPGPALCMRFHLPSEAVAKTQCHANFNSGKGDYLSLIVEELSEAVEAWKDPDGRRKELVQLTALCLQALVAHDLRELAKAPYEGLRCMCGQLYCADPDNCKGECGCERCKAWNEDAEWDAWISG